VYHARLQRLGLVPANQLLPAWRTLVPWSASSPLTPLSRQYAASASVADCMLALVTSPVVLVCVEHFAERWVYACIHEAVESSVLRPENAALASRQYADKEWPATGRGGQSPPALRRWINRVLVFLGWGRPLRTNPKTGGGHSMPVGSTQVARPGAFETPFRDGQDGLATTSSTRAPPAARAGGLGEEPTDDDPRIRITSREGIVEMEVRLPSRVLSTHTEEVEAAGLAEARGAAGAGPARGHHVTQLSLEPGLLVGALVKARVVSLSLAPLQAMSSRLLARHFAARQQALVAGWPAGREVSQWALCAGLEVGVDLGLWGVQYAAVTWLGRGLFGWGRL